MSRRTRNAGAAKCDQYTAPAFAGDNRRLPLTLHGLVVVAAFTPARDPGPDRLTLRSRMDRAAFVAQLAEGDESAWLEFTREFHPLIRTVASRVGLRGEDREDVVQKVCLVAIQHVESLRDPDKMASWVYGVARRVAIDHRRGAPREISVDDIEGLAESTAAAATLPDIEEALHRARCVAELHDAVSRLDARCQRLLRALYLDDPPATYDVISDREGMPVGSIGPTRGRCLEKLTRIYLEVLSAPVSPTTSSGRPAGPRSRAGVTPAAPKKEC